MAGAKTKGVAEKKANEIFDLMEPFAGYAFNKAHAVCYAMVAYQTAYLKANYPVEYMSALMACFIEKSDKLVTCMDECKRMGIPVLPPDINLSGADFTVEGERNGADTQRSQAIRFGLAAIKNVGRAAVEVILRCRNQDGPFTNLSDFVHRVMSGDGGVSRGTMEALIQCGAFGSLVGHGNRRALVECLDDCISMGTRAQRDKKLGQASLADMFGDDEDALGTASAPAIAIPSIPDYPRDAILGFERDLLGLYVSDHPLQAYAPTFERKNAVKVIELAEMGDRQEVTLGGIITGVKPFTSKKSGEPMVFFNLEDMTGTVSCTMFPKVFETFGPAVQKDSIVLLNGKTSHRERVRDDDDGGTIVEILADSVTPLSSPSGNAGAGREIHISLDPSRREMLRWVHETIGQHRGNGSALPVFVRVPDGGQTHGRPHGTAGGVLARLRAGPGKTPRQAGDLAGIAVCGANTSSRQNGGQKPFALTMGYVSFILLSDLCWQERRRSRP